VQILQFRIQLLLATLLFTRV
jgi:hypothetical protein